MGWVSSHIAGRDAYEFINDYEKTPANSTLNHTGSFSVGFAIRPKEGQLNYALLLKGDINESPLEKLKNHTMFFWSDQGYLYIRIYGSSGAGFCVYLKSLDNILNTTNVIDIELTFDIENKSIILWKNATSIPYEILSIGGDSISSLSELGTSTFPAVFNSNSTDKYLGKAKNFQQFEGIIYDQRYYAKVRKPSEISATYSQNQDPAPSALQKIFFISSRNTTPARLQLYTMDVKGGNQTLFKSSAVSVYDPRVNKSNVALKNATKATWSEGSNGIYVSDIDGGNTQQYLEATTANQLSFNYVLDKVVYCRFDSGTSKTQIFIADFNSSTNIISNEILLSNYVGNNNYNHSQPSFSIDGTKIYLCRKRVGSGDNSYLTVMENNPTSPNPINLFSGNDQEYFYSPLCNMQGTKLGFSQKVFMGSTLSYKYQVFICDLDGGNLQRLTGDAFDSYFQDFSKDGTKIVYFCPPFANYQNIFKMDIDGKNKICLSGTILTAYDSSNCSWFAPSGT